MSSKRWPSALAVRASSSSFSQFWRHWRNLAAQDVSWLYHLETYSYHRCSYISSAGLFAKDPFFCGAVCQRSRDQSRNWHHSTSHWIRNWVNRNHLEILDFLQVSFVNLWQKRRQKRPTKIGTRLLGSEMQVPLQIILRSRTVNCDIFAPLSRELPKILNQSWVT